MTKSKTMFAIASLLAVGFTSSAFAGDSNLSPEALHYPQRVKQQSYVQTGADAYAQAPAQRRTTFSDAERREFDRATESASSR